MSKRHRDFHNLISWLRLTYLIHKMIPGHTSGRTMGKSSVENGVPKQVKGVKIISNMLSLPGLFNSQYHLIEVPNAIHDLLTCTGHPNVSMRYRIAVHGQTDI